MPEAEQLRSDDQTHSITPSRRRTRTPYQHAHPTPAHTSPLKVI